LSIKTVKLVILGARLSTLFVSVAPVILGSFVAVSGQKDSLSHLNIAHLLLALIVAVFIQIGTNFANDYSDGIRGVDLNRQGPPRLVGDNLMKKEHVKVLAISSFLIACLFGAIISILVNPYLLILGGLCVIAGVLYTGGPKPYGYIGLGELFVFLFFGLAATLGSAYVQNPNIDIAELYCGVILGIQAAGVLLTNNIRDIESDKKNNKITLCVRLGKRRSEVLLAFLVVISMIITILLAATLKKPYVLLGLIAYVGFYRAVLYVFDTKGPYLVRALKLMSISELIFSILASVGTLL
jgi:1,4-dihydroxy-2-naphthoate octaprenyltransferase